MLKQFLRIAVLLAACYAPLAVADLGHESKGGSPIKDRFRRIGSFLAHHLDTRQVRLAHRLKSFDRFKATVPQVPVQVVANFPPQFAAIAGEELVGATVDDTASPVGKTILLHAQRFQAALEQFDRGREITITVLGDPGQAVKVTEADSARYLIQTSFLSFCLHEFLLASGEDDTRTQISSLLSASRADLEDWQKNQGPLQDVTVWMQLPYLRGPIVAATGDEQADDAKALQLFLAEYNRSGKAAEEAAKQKIVEEVEKKAPVLKATVEKQLPVKYALNLYNNDMEEFHRSPIVVDSRPVRLRAGVFYYTQKTVYLTLDTDLKPRIIDRNYIKGVPQRYREFYADNSLLHNFVGLLEADPTAYQSMVEAVPAQMASAKQLAQSLYGDSLLYFGPGGVFGEFATPNGTNVYYRTVSIWAQYGADEVERVYSMLPNGWVLE